MQRTILILFLLSTILVNAQNSEAMECNLEKDNKLWKIQFANAKTKAQRIVLIREKIISDSIYHEIQPVVKTVHGPILEYADQNGNYCGWKIQFILQFTGGNWYELNLNKKPQLLSLLMTLDSINLDHIYYDLRNNNRPSSRVGMVKLTTRDSSLKRMVKNVW